MFLFRILHFAVFIKDKSSKIWKLSFLCYNYNLLIPLRTNLFCGDKPDKRPQQKRVNQSNPFSRPVLSLCNVMELSALSFHATRPPLFKRQKKRNRRLDKRRRHVLYPKFNCWKETTSPRSGRKMGLRHRPVCGPPVPCFRTHYGVHQLTDKWREMVKNGCGTTTTW